VGAFGADLGLTLVYGFIIVIPTVIISGPILGRIIKNVSSGSGNSTSVTQPSQIDKLPSVASSFLIALTPVILITLAVFANNFLQDGDQLRTVVLFIGDPNIALLISVVLAIYFFGLKRGETMQTIMTWLERGISGIAMILLIITAGGVLKQVLLDSGTANYITSFSSQWTINPLLFGWIITALLRVTIGSATVAGLTAAGIVAPLVTNGQVSPELMVLSVGAGSIFGSHINDTGFWMFKEFLNLSLKQTFLSWTVMETLMSVLGLIGVLVLQMII
jgi:gluconate transporter